jgi:hypothetical protein
LSNVERRAPATPEAAPPKRVADRIAAALLELVSQVPSSGEKASASPRERARALVLQASAKAAMVSGTLALPPGPLGMLTLLPDLLAIWNIQRQLVSDIAATYRKSAQLGSSEMIYCLFRHAATQAVKDVVVRAGERFLVRHGTLGLMQRVLRRVGISVTQRTAGRALARWLPVVGAVGIGGYAFYDTAQVGKTAIAFFEKEIVREQGSDPARAT